VSHVQPDRIARDGCTGLGPITAAGWVASLLRATLFIPPTGTAKKSSSVARRDLQWERTESLPRHLEQKKLAQLAQVT